eukprot:1565349-Ditylum_brightwellii.AAC.1
MKGATEDTVKGIKSIQIQTDSTMTDKLNWSQLTDSSSDMTLTTNNPAEKESMVEESVYPTTSDSSTDYEHDSEILT